MPWGGSTLPGGKHSPYWGKAWVKDPTMEELENHVTDGLKFVCVSALSSLQACPDCQDCRSASGL
jgi:hypothetical protein